MWSCLGPTFRTRSLEAHGSARLTARGRLTMVLRIESGRPIAHIAEEMGVSRPTASKWWHRWLTEGPDGLVDRSSRPYSSPTRTSDEVAAQIAELRRELKLGPVRIGWRLGVPASTVHRVLTRLGLNRLAWMAHRRSDPPLRTRTSRRHDSRRHQETRQDPRRRRLARRWSKPRADQHHQRSDGLRLHPLSSR